MARRSTTSTPTAQPNGLIAEFKIGDKVKVVRNCNRYMSIPPGTMGKEGKVTGAITPHSCRVKIAYGEEVWVEFRELELVKESIEKPVAGKTTVKRRKK